MPYFATNYVPITAEYFKFRKPYFHKAEQRRPIVGIHIFKWNPEVSSIKIKTIGGSEITFSGNALVEGAVYWIGVSEVIEVKDSPENTEIFGIISTFKQI
jgi:hypothetical protein